MNKSGDRDHFSSVMIHLFSVTIPLFHFQWFFLLFCFFSIFKFFFFFYYPLLLKFLLGLLQIIWFLVFLKKLKSDLLDSEIFNIFFFSSNHCESESILNEASFIHRSHWSKQKSKLQLTCSFINFGDNFDCTNNYSKLVNYWCLQESLVPGILWQRKPAMFPPGDLFVTLVCPLLYYFNWFFSILNMKSWTHSV